MLISVETRIFGITAISRSLPLLPLLNVVYVYAHVYLLSADEVKLFVWS